MIREYESTFVLDPNTPDDQVDQEVTKVTDFLTSKDGEVMEIQKWGRRKLAYEINKRKEGIYTLIRFKAEAEVPVELDRRYRLNESMLRYLTVIYEKAPAGEGLEEGSEEDSRDRSDRRGESDRRGDSDSVRPASRSEAARPAAASAASATATATAVVGDAPAKDASTKDEPAQDEPAQDEPKPAQDTGEAQQTDAEPEDEASKE